MKLGQTHQQHADDRTDDIRDQPHQSSSSITSTLCSLKNPTNNADPSKQILFSFLLPTASSLAHWQFSTCSQFNVGLLAPYTVSGSSHSIWLTPPPLHLCRSHPGYLAGPFPSFRPPYQIESTPTNTFHPEPRQFSQRNPPLLRAFSSILLHANYDETRKAIA